MRPTVHFSLLSMLLSEIKLGTQDAMLYTFPFFSPSKFFFNRALKSSGGVVGGAALLVIWWKPQGLSVLRMNAGLR